MYVCMYVCIDILMYICIYILIQESWRTVVESDPKAPFSIATTPRRKGGRYFFP